jgi:hypothetical protein
MSDFIDPYFTKKGKVRSPRATERLLRKIKELESSVHFDDTHEAWGDMPMGFDYLEQTWESSGSSFRR